MATLKAAIASPALKKTDVFVDNLHSLTGLVLKDFYSFLLL